MIGIVKMEELEFENIYKFKVVLILIYCEVRRKDFFDLIYKN